jgi:ATP-dependent helicase/nuclease subunit B
VRLCRRAREVLASGWYDEGDLVAAAVEAVDEGSPPAGELGHLIVYLVQDLTQRQARLVRAVADHRPATAVVALTGVAAADAGVVRSLERLGCPLPSLEPTPSPGEVPSTAPGVVVPVRAGRTRVVTASDADEEVRAAVRAIVGAARSGTPLERIAVLLGSPEPYGRLVHEHLAAASIPRNGTAVRPLAASTVGRMLLDLLALPDHGFRRADVMGLLARSTLRGPTGHPAPVGEWQRLSREAGVVAGRDDWDRLLGRLADSLDVRADEFEAWAELVDSEAASDPDSTPGGDDPQGRLFDPEPRVTADPATAASTEAAEADVGVDPSGRSALGGRFRRRAASARALQSVVLGLVDDLTQAAAQPRPWRVRVAWARRLVARFAGGERDRWPVDEVKAAEAVEAALDRLATLDAIDAPPDLDVFRRTLTLELDADLGRIGRYGEGVLVAPLPLALGLDLDLVVVLGMAEGTLPGPVRDDSLLPDGERQRTAGELPLRRERVGRDHRRLWAALAGSDRHLLCAPRGDLRVSNERVASRWLLAAASALAGRDVTADGLGSLDAGWVE